MTTRLPPPPRELPALRDDDILRAPTGATFGRIFFAAAPHSASWSGMRSYGPLATMRFDHHPPPPRVHPTRAVAYVAPSSGRDGQPSDPLATAVSECFATTRTIDVRTRAPWFVLWRSTRPLFLLDVVDSAWVTRAGGNAAISSGARGTARRWSRAAYASYPDLDGIYYQSSTLPRSRSVMLFERAASTIPERFDLMMPLSHPGLLRPLKRIASDLGLGMVL